MIEREFMNKVANSKDDFLQKFIDILEKENISYCIVGGLAVNAYAEPVVSLDLDVVVVANKLGSLVSELKKCFQSKCILIASILLNPPQIYVSKCRLIRDTNLLLIEQFVRLFLDTMSLWQK